MSRERPIRNQFGTIVGLQPKEETDQVKATLEASMQAVGAMPEVAPPPAPTKWPLPPPPSLRIEIIAAAVVLVAVMLTFLSRGSRTPATIIPTVTAAPTWTPRPSATPTTIVPINPHAVTLSAITLYGDYDEGTKIGSAPEGMVCTLSGQSPDGLWAFIACPAPTGKVWAEVEDLELNTDQRGVLLDIRVISRVVPTFSPPAPQGAGLAFCADRSSIWGTTHQCASSQAAADALADSDMGRINATAEAIRKR